MSNSIWNIIHHGLGSFAGMVCVAVVLFFSWILVQKCVEDISRLAFGFSFHMGAALSHFQGFCRHRTSFRIGSSLHMGVSADMWVSFHMGSSSHIFGPPLHITERQDRGFIWRFSLYGPSLRLGTRLSSFLDSFPYIGFLSTWGLRFTKVLLQWSSKIPAVLGTSQDTS